MEDKDRPLSERGANDIPIMSARLRKKSSIEAIISSTALRAFATANSIAEGIGFPVESVTLNSDIYLAGPIKLLEIVRNLDDRMGEVMLVCHNPTITEFANCMLGAIIDNIPTCGLVKLKLNINSWVYTEFEKGTLLDFDYPYWILTIPKRGIECEYCIISLSLLFWCLVVPTQLTDL